LGQPAKVCLKRVVENLNLSKKNIMKIVGKFPLVPLLKNPGSATEI